MYHYINDCRFFLQNSKNVSKYIYLRFFFAENNLNEGQAISL